MDHIQFSLLSFSLLISHNCLIFTVPVCFEGKLTEAACLETFQFAFLFLNSVSQKHLEETQRLSA